MNLLPVPPHCANLGKRRKRDEAALHELRALQDAASEHATWVGRPAPDGESLKELRQDMLSKRRTMAKTQVDVDEPSAVVDNTNRGGRGSKDIGRFMFEEF